MQRFALCVALLFIITPVAETLQIGGLQDVIRRWINRIFDRESITEVSDILENPKNFEGKEITVEGIFTDSSYFGWVRGDLWGIEDDGAVITVNIKQNETLKGREFYRYVDSLYDKKVRVKGEIELLKDGRELKPLLIADVSEIRVIE